MEKDLLSLERCSKDDITGLLETARLLKSRRKKHSRKPMRVLEGRNIAMVFEKPSLRTRVTFEVAMNDLGGSCIYLAPENIQIGKRESAQDIARNLERWVDAVVARTFSQKTLEDVAGFAKIPVIDALSDKYHPCQALAFGLTLLERKKRLVGQKVVFIGDGNNVCHSIMTFCAKLGLNFVLAHPAGFGPDPEVFKTASAFASLSGGSVALTADPKKAVNGADVVYTDTWTSMGQENEEKKRRKIFSRFQVNSKLLSYAPRGCLVSHCLPAHRGLEITDDMLDSSMAFDEAENRLHVQKAVLLALVAKKSLR